MGLILDTSALVAWERAISKGVRLSLSEGEELALPAIVWAEALAGVRLADSAKRAAQRLSRLEDELRFVLITSYARVHPDQDRGADAIHFTLASGDELWVSVAASAHAKCVRCWHHREDVGANAEHPELCGRCVENVAGQGEVRKHA